jgi:chitin disaccharide deacetylase
LSTSSFTDIRPQNVYAIGSRVFRGNPRLAPATRNYRAMVESGATNLMSSSVNALIINADDWGRDVSTTDRILDCIQTGTVSSTSAMLFMKDSRRAASLAMEQGIDCGLHLNFTTPFSAPDCPVRLREHQEQTIRYLRRNRLAQTVYHPGLASSFKYVAAAQLEQFEKLFGDPPNRFDGHHHMHLCANVLFSGVIPAGVIMRRNFSFRPSEKGRINRLYRNTVDRLLAKRYQLTDYFFSLPPLEPSSRIDEIFSLSRRSIVEVETHPTNPQEYCFLSSGEILQRAGNAQISRGFTNSAFAR